MKNNLTRSHVASYFSADIVIEAEHSPLNGLEQIPELLAMLTHLSVPPHHIDLKIIHVVHIRYPLGYIMIPQYSPPGGPIRNFGVNIMV